MDSQTRKEKALDRCMWGPNFDEDDFWRASKEIFDIHAEAIEKKKAESAAHRDHQIKTAARWARNEALQKEQNKDAKLSEEHSSARTEQAIAGAARIGKSQRYYTRRERRNRYYTKKAMQKKSKEVGKGGKKL